MLGCHHIIRSEAVHNIVIAAVISSGFRAINLKEASELDDDLTKMKEAPSLDVLG